ncbi:FRG domain-containing protein [Hydrogenovibrio sp. SC-1]|uniref:FRG domain-containing protein n=1 Tax=Hydrogenovibrio sp. SC-1 TaxID=2065820 RepID=UPI000C7C244E|nr:FRG domain-containing protein [Hydrogenovibrio sp. SC-1]PLA73402.1 FRG domain-containing protein [Hydrogenovibrio sp. SC-1]
MRGIEGKITQKLATVIDEKDIASGDGFPVDTYRELVEYCAALAYLNKDHLLFFRGQGVDFKNKNDKSTFYPSIYRGDYLPKREVEHRFDILNQASSKLVELLSTRTKDGTGELKRKKYIQWSILQHYEVCGTPLIDLTHSLRVACSFAQLENENDHAYVYVFGLPYITNRISINSEHDLINIRLLSICPPDALRPYFQEGYLAATSDIEHEYDSKSELDFNRRLVVKFRIPNSSKFWGKDFKIIPKSALYPQQDIFHSICKEIELDVKRELKPGEIGEFLSLWSEIEEKVVSMNQQAREHNTFFSSLKQLKTSEYFDSSLINNIEKLRRFRNELVHSPKRISDKEITPYMELVRFVTNEIKRQS